MLKLFRFTLLSLVLAVSSVSIAAVDYSEKRVLILFSYHPSFPTSEKVRAGVQSAFSETTPTIDIEYLDSKRIHDDRSRSNYLAMLSYKLGNRAAYDAIITVDDNALDLALNHRHQLFPKAPVIFLGVNDIDKALSLEPVDDVTGIVEEASFKETMALASKMLPEIRTFHVIADSLTSGQADLKKIRALSLPASSPQLAEVLLAELSWAELGDYVAKLGREDAILLVSAYMDKQGTSLDFEESLEIITDNTKAPIFHMWEHGIGLGVLGGVVVSHGEQGRLAAEMAKQIMSGESAASIPILATSPNIPSFDFRELKARQIDPTGLPENSNILFQPDSLWESYKIQIISILCVFAALAGFAVLLGRNNLRMRVLSRKLMENTSFLEQLIESSPDLIWVRDPQGVYRISNKRANRFLGVEKADIIGKTPYDFVDKELAAYFLGRDLQVLKSGEQSVYENVLNFKSDGHTEILETIKTPLFDPVSGEPVGVLGVSRDITKRKEAEEASRLASSVFANTAEGILVTDTMGNILEVNKAFTEITGYSRDEVLGQNPRILKSGRYDDAFYLQMWKTLTEKGSWSGEFLNRHKNGQLFPIWQTITAVADDAGHTTHFISIFSDILQLKESQEKIEHLAYHDSLTNLPNRVLLHAQLERAIKHAKRNNSTFTLMYLDLDNFKNINDSLGHPEGDKLLVKVAEYLQAAVREEDTVARLGGDEFVLLFNEAISEESLEGIAQKVLIALQKPIELKNKLVNISASIGVCSYPKDGMTADDLFRNGDSAMYRAKQSGRNNYQFYTQELTRDVTERVDVEADIRQAIVAGQFFLEYQPQIDLQTGKLEGVEALIRWNHPTKGLIAPNAFIPIAEASNLILDIGRWVLINAVSQIKSWIDEGIDFKRVAVNISGQQLQRGDLVQEVSDVLSRYGVSADHLTVEITETYIMEHKEIAVQQLKALESMGIEIAIDDFGTGYSSLSYLKRLPIHKLKIDRSFIRDIPDDADDMVITKTVIALGESLNFRVIAEGVETPAQAEFLQSVGCHEVQGYLYSKPIPAEKLHAFAQLHS